LADVPVRIDEFAFILLAGVVLIAVLMIVWTTYPPEEPPAVTPTLIEIVARPGSYKNFTFTLMGNLSRVDLEASGQISDWITFQENHFSMKIKKTVNVRLIVPDQAVEGFYYGKIVVSSSAEKNKTIDVRIEVKKRTPVETKLISFGDFSVSYDIGTDILDSKSDEEVYKSYISEKSLTLVHPSIPDDRFSILKSGRINILIERSSGFGNLLVYFNDEEIFNRPAGAGELIIDLNISNFKKSNNVLIKAAGPGLQFWSSNSFSIRSASISVDYEGTSFKNFTFSLSEKEVSGFLGGNVEFTIKESSKKADMLIMINDQLVFKGKPLTYFNVDFGKDIYVKEGLNTIYFSTEKGASFDLEDVYLRIDYEG